MPDPNPIEEYLYGHGTGVAGVVAALANNTLGIAGIAGGWQANSQDIGGVSLVAIKVTDNYGNVANNRILANAIYESADPTHFGCNILNCSWGSYGYSEVLREAINFAYRLGANVVAAKGRNGVSNPTYPADFDYSWITCIGGYGQNGLFCVIGNCEYATDYGQGLDMLAPGYSIFTTWFYNSFSQRNGNSFAVPHAAGSIGLMKSILPDLRNEDADWMLKYSASDPPPPYSDNNVWTWDERYGHGDLRISTVINRIGNPSIQPFDYLTHDARGGEVASSVHYPSYTFIGSPLNGTYTTTVHEIRVNLSYPESYDGMPFVWAVGQGTSGWSGAQPNYQDGWARVVPGSESKTGCQMQTFVYEVWDNQPGQPHWYPCQPENVSIIWGIKSAIQPNNPGGDKWVRSSDEITEITVEASPNPFNSYIILRINLPYESRVAIDIYDILGREVANLADRK